MFLPNLVASVVIFLARSGLPAKWEWAAGWGQSSVSNLPLNSCVTSGRLLNFSDLQMGFCDSVCHQVRQAVGALWVASFSSFLASAVPLGLRLQRWVSLDLIAVFKETTEWPRWGLGNFLDQEWGNLSSSQSWLSPTSDIRPFSAPLGLTFVPCKREPGQASLRSPVCLVSFCLVLFRSGQARVWGDSAVAGGYRLCQRFPFRPLSSTPPAASSRCSGGASWLQPEVGTVDEDSFGMSGSEGGRFCRGRMSQRCSWLCVTVQLRQCWGHYSHHPSGWKSPLVKRVAYVDGAAHEACWVCTRLGAGSLAVGREAVTE